MYLVCQQGPLQGASFKLAEGRNSLGRDISCDIVLDDPKVSRLHAYLILADGDVTCVDNNSTNGVYLNGRRLDAEAPHRLAPRDVIIIGGNEYNLSAFGDFATLHFSAVEPNVMGVIKSDAVAKKFSEMFDSYYEEGMDTRKGAALDLAKMRKLMHSLETLYKMSNRIAAVMPADQLLAEMRDLLFGIFRGAENLVFLLWDEESEEYLPKLIANSQSATNLPVMIPHSVFHRALQERVTLLASDASHDSRFAESQSIIGLSVRSLMCAPLVYGKRVLGAIYIDNRSQMVTYDESDAELLTAFAAQAAVAFENARLFESLQRSYHSTLQALVNTIEAKDRYTSGHSQRVARFTRGIAEELAFAPERLEILQAAAELHDIGKIGIKERIINKAERLSDTEYREIKEHVLTGEKILEPIHYLKPMLSVIRNHHERWDGKGYPDGLAGEAISLEARILCAADAFDAMTTQRAYNKPLAPREALEKLRAAAGTQFDPSVIEAFGRYLEKAVFSQSEAAKVQA